MDLILEQTKKALPLAITRPMPVSSSRLPPTARLHKKVVMIDEQLRTLVESQPPWPEPRYGMMGMEVGGLLVKKLFLPGFGAGRSRCATDLPDRDSSKLAHFALDK